MDNESFLDESPMGKAEGGEAKKQKHYRTQERTGKP